MIPRLTEDERKEVKRKLIEEYGEKEGFNIYLEMIKWENKR
jgi:hypothetical protein